MLECVWDREDGSSLDELLSSFCPGYWWDGLPSVFYGKLHCVSGMNFRDLLDMTRRNVNVRTDRLSCLPLCSGGGRLWWKILPTTEDTAIPTLQTVPNRITFITGFCKLCVKSGSTCINCILSHRWESAWTCPPKEPEEDSGDPQREKERG